MYQRTDGERGVLLGFCGVGLELIETLIGRGRPSGPESCDVHIVFALGCADSVDTLTTRLAAAGHRIIEHPHRSGDGSYCSAIFDPDGNRVGLTV